MKVRLLIEIEDKSYGSEMKILWVEPEPNKIPERIKEMIYEDYNINLEDEIKPKTIRL